MKARVGLDNVSILQLKTWLTRPKVIWGPADAAVHGLLERAAGGAEINLSRNVALMLSDATPEGLAIAADMAGEAADRLCDPIAARMLLAHGVNPIALLAIEIALGETTNKEHVARLGGDGGEAVGYVSLGKRRLAPPNDPDGVTVSFSSGCWWDGRALRVPGHALPDTAAVNLEGRALHAIVDHPALPRCAVTSAEYTKLGDLVLHTDHEPRPATWREALIDSERKAA